MTDQDVRRRLISPQWWLRDSEGRWAIAQLPNPALTVGLITPIIRSIAVSWARTAALAQVGRGAVVVGATGGRVRGASPLRSPRRSIAARGLGRAHVESLR